MNRIEATLSNFHLANSHTQPDSNLLYVTLSGKFDTHVFEVGCLVKVGDLDVGGLRRVRPLLFDQLAQLGPPQQLLGRGTGKKTFS